MTNAKFYIWNDGEYKQVNIDYSKSTYFTNRRDGSNEIGEFSFYSKTFTSDILPFTRAKVVEPNKETFFFASSVCNAIVTRPDVYFHACKLTDSNEILKCYFLGPKMFSTTGTNKKDYEKLNVINLLFRDKYKIGLTFVNSSKFTSEQTFSFSENDTLYDMLYAISNKYNYTFRVTDANNAYITIEFSLMAPSTEEGSCAYVLEDKRVLSVEYSHEQDLVCDNLETNLTNVVDRTNPVTYYNLPLMSDEDVITYDNCKLLLPCNIEQIKKVDIYTEYGKGYFQLCLTAPTSYFTNVTLNSKYTYNELRALNASLANLALMMIDCAKNVGNIEISTNTKQFYVNKNYIWLVKNDTTTNSLLEIEKATITTQILEKSQFDLLSSTISNKYLYYEQGKNYIANFQGGKNKGIINDILGISTKDFLVTLTQSIKNYLMLPSGCGYYKDADGDEQVYLSLLKSYQTTIIGSDTSKVMFDITCIPMIDALLIDNSNITNFNIARPYNANGNKVDFDKAVPLLQRIHNQMGVGELLLGYDMTNNGANNFHFQPFNIIMYKGRQYFIQSIQKTFLSTTSVRYDLALTSEQISYSYDMNIENRFDVLNNPNDDIIDRIINLKTTCDNSTMEYLKSGNVFVRCDFFDDLTNHKTLYKRATPIYANGKMVIAVYTLDNYCFDKAYGKYSNSKNLVDYCQYVNEYNESAYVQISIGKIESLTYDQAKALPKYDNGFDERPSGVSRISFGSKPIYKDARERLIFTIELDLA